MAGTDNPLKLLIADFPETYAEWLLGVPVRHVQPLNVELPAEAQQSDLLFLVTLEDGTTALLHIELQGRRTRRPMPWRMLDYISRIVLRELSSSLPDQSVRLHSVVLYVERGAGLGDSGAHTIYDVDGGVALQWRYEPVLLWQMEADELLQLHKPAVLPLIARTTIRQPELVLSEIVSAIRSVPDLDRQERLFTTLIGLLNDEEIAEMLEKILDEEDEWFANSPFVRRLYQRGVQEGREEGIEEGIEQGLEQGREEGLEQGHQEGLRTAILAVVRVRFDPPVSLYETIGKLLKSYTASEQLQSLLTAVVQAQTLTDFVAKLQPPATPTGDTAVSSE